jgi:hypothetical protein|tara:strand:+ start:250 stop:513 length:264 start_codon:yes stop_codon:yes gene_type:complete
MKIFFVKTIIVGAVFYVVFELTIGIKIKQAQEIVLKYKNKTERIKIKEKIISEIELVNKKDKILNEVDKKVLSEFIQKIRKELDIIK